MTDIAPELWEKISAEFEAALKNDKEIARLYEKIRSGKATYEEAQIFSQRIGKLSSLALTDNITAEALPDGKMYFNIAERTVRPALERDYELISDVSAEVQASLNEAAGIGMNPVIPEMNEDRVSGLIDKLTEDGKPFDDVRSFLEDPVMNFCQNIVDESVRANAEMHYASGMTPKIKRIMTGHKACEFCIERAGEFKYPLPDNRIYQRHENCRCLVLYDPGNGKYQDAHSKKYFTSERDAVEEKLKNAEKRNIKNSIISANRFGQKAVPYSERGIEVEQRITDALGELTNSGKYITVNKNELNLRDLAVMTTETGDEFAKLTFGEKSIIIRGTDKGTVISDNILKTVMEGHGELEGHTHPFIGDLIPSAEDISFLKEYFPYQKKSLLVDPNQEAIEYDILGNVTTVLLERRRDEW